ncbi:MAG TPA: chromosome segregation protein SMC [Candidatus Gastranaerophilales bacterium]|nr:chromosome segregation protein SMC [Candidatus Gastranaerophilales bacterium]
MHISKIEIDNFKSFANPTDIPFLQGFTTVSGPNGSGKSNIIDSILFCLGLSSSKTLRADRLFHLINTHNKKNEASVKVCFSNGTGQENLSVKRKIKKTSAGFISNYYLNDKTSTLNEIHDELSKHNISPGCYNVMMQGDVTSIINISATERRKIIDEIAGVADFDRRIEQAKKELETVEQRVEKSGVILGEIEYRLIQLEEEKNHALKYQKIRDEKQELEKKLRVVRYFEIKNSFERLHESILEANKNKKEEDKKLSELVIRLEETHKKQLELSEQIKNKGEDEQIEIKKQMESLKGLIARKKDSLRLSEKQAQDNLKGIETAKYNIENLKQKIKDSSHRINLKNEEIESIEEKIKFEKQKLENLLQEVSGVNKAATEQLEKRNSLRKLFENKKDEENALLKEKLTSEERVSRLQKTIDEANSVIIEAEGFKNSNTERRNVLETQINELSKELKDYEIVQKNNLEYLDKLKNEISDHNYNINAAYRKITQLEATKRASEEAGFGRAIDTIMNSGVKGIHAPLAQLGKVNQEYSTALEIAMGGRMRCIVVDDDEVARVAIEVLKSSQAGRATFLPLNKMNSKPWGMKVPKEPGVIDFAINLIEFDNVYESTFYYALGDTLIVEDLISSRKLAGKYRMVTVDGSLVEKTGAMTGGSVHKSGLKFAQSQDDELNTLKERFQKLQDKATELDKKKQETENKLDNVRRDYSDALNEFNRKKFELENFDKNTKDAELKIIKSHELLEIKMPELLEAQDHFNIKGLELDNISKQIAELAEEIEKVEKSLPENELTKLNNLSQNIEKEIKTCESSLSACQNDIKAVKMEIEFNENSIKIHNERIEQLFGENINLDKEKEVFAAEIIQTDERLNELQDKINEIGTELTTLQSERDGLNVELTGLERNKVGFETRIERLIEQVEAFKTRRKELEPELDEIRQELIQQGYEVSQLKPTEVSLDEVNKAITKLEKRMTEMEPVNMKALTEYDEVKTRKEELESRINTLTNEKNQIIDKMNSYEELKIKSFRETYDQINTNFKVIFNQLSDGEGRIVLENDINPLAGGLTIEAQPRDKKMQRLESMSGGEKSLTALAFVFAIQRHMPAPFYAFDEVDMHLDGINSEKLAHLIKSQSSNAQFIVVSLRKPMIEAADRTIGVTQKNSGITKVTGVRLHG